MAAAYALFWLLTRIPAVNAFFAYTTLTRAYRRYHEPDTEKREIGRRGENLKGVRYSGDESNRNVFGINGPSRNRTLGRKQPNYS